MRESITVIIFCLIITILIDIQMTASDQGKDIGAPGPKEVLIGPNGVIMPLGKILIVRKDVNYCVIRFTKYWEGKTEGDRYATYEAYYQDDKTGDFTNNNVKFKKEELHSPKPSFGLFGHPFAFGAKEEIQCGGMKLWWSGKGTVYYFGRYQRQGDYGIEFAPTKWTDISQVNVFDQRLKWYRYDENRKDVIIPVDQLWEEKEK